MAVKLGSLALSAANTVKELQNRAIRSRDEIRR
jgi:hypothetical protein